MGKARPRCACGRARRQAATACQRCLEAEAATRRAAEPPRKWARDWRADGWLCVFIGGRVIIAIRGAQSDEPEERDQQRGVVVSSARWQPIDGGRWASALDASSPSWSTFGAAETIAIAPLLRAIARDCYCASFEDGCDFCNGRRLPDGAKETV